jgi:hypothetical protein
MIDCDLTITGIHRISKPQTWAAGETPLAFFAVEARGFEIRGCTLLKNKNGGFFSLMPRGQTETGARAVACHDQQLLDTMTSAAKRAFEALGGKL